MAKVTMPQLGESVAEGTIGKWLKKPGDHVAKYEPLLEVITDKVNAEVPSPFEGVLAEILVEEGATVPNNAEIAVIDEAGAAEAPGAGGASGAGVASGTSGGASGTTGAASGTTGPSAAAGRAGAGAGEAPGAPSADNTSRATGRPGATSAGGAVASDSQPTAVASQSATPTPAAAAAPDETREPETPVPAQTGPVRGSAAENGAASLAAARPPSVAHGPAGSNERRPSDVSSDHHGPGNGDARMTPAVRRLLREHGLSAAMIVGSGGGGRITREDVTDFVESQRTGMPVGKQDASAAGRAETAAATGAAAAPTTAAPASAPPSVSSGSRATTSAPAPAPSASPAASIGSGGTRIEFPAGADEVLVPMTQMRKGIAAQMTRALQVPHAYVQMEVDVTNLVRFREAARRDFQAHEGLSLSYVPFVVKASAEALKRNPTFNAHWTDQGLVAKRRINVGIAVAVEDGLIVPVIRDVDTLSIAGINRAIADVSERARAGRLRVDDFGGGTFTVDNTGWLGTNMVMPIINVPEVAIVTMDRITKRPVVVETPDGDVIAIRPVMNMVLGVDHRANDGAGGAALLRDIKAWLEAVGTTLPLY